MKKKQGMVRLACGVLCAALLAGSALAAGDACPAWAEEAAGVWTDCGKLDSEMDYGKALTRGELAVMVDSVLALEEATGGTISDLTGVQSTDEALSRLVGAGVFTLDGDGKVWPERQVTRQEAAVILARAFGLTAQGGADYTDADVIAPWATQAVAALQQAGVMSGSGGAFRPEDDMSYAQALVAIANAVDAAGPVTGITALERSAEGVLIEGAETHVNDGKFRIKSVERTQDGFLVELEGLEALVGQQADSDGTGRPEQAGKWMGIRLSFAGLVRINQYQYSQDGQQWIALGFNEAIPQTDRMNSVMVFVNGAQSADADAKEVEKTSTVTFRLSQGGESFNVSFHYTPKR